MIIQIYSNTVIVISYYIYGIINRLIIIVVLYIYTFILKKNVIYRFVYLNDLC